MLMPAPRTCRVRSSSRLSRSCPLKTISPRARACGMSSRMMESAVTDFPEPDSPTSPSASPSAMSKATSRTAGVQPAALGKSTFRSLTESNDIAAIEVIAVFLPLTQLLLTQLLLTQHQRQSILRVADDDDLRVLGIGEVLGGLDALPRQQFR